MTTETVRDYAAMSSVGASIIYADAMHLILVRYATYSPSADYSSAATTIML